MVERDDSAHAGARRLLTLAAGAVAVGVHAGLAPEHLHEWLPLGASFVASAAVCGAAVSAAALRPTSPWAWRLLALVLAGLVVAYVLTRLVALPPLDPEQEELDTVGIVTVVVEAVGALAVLGLPFRISMGSGLLFASRKGGTR